MTEILEKVSVNMHAPGDEACPFCPGKEEKDWSTFKGEDNDSGKLRSYMNKPSTNGFAQQKGARPKDGNEGRQNADIEKTSPDPIFSSPKYGSYYDQAHHAISGNEIMKGHKIEKVITKEGNFKGDTGYTINNCANGIYLPAYPKAFKGIWGSTRYPKEYPTQNGDAAKIVNNVAEDQSFKLEIMEKAMDKHGQAHIGGHSHFYLEDMEGYRDDYPTAVGKKLTEIVARVKEKGEECPFCFEGDKPQKPFLPPYRVNQWLDNLSKDVAQDIGGAPKSWPYFISSIARDYFKRVAKPKSAKSKLMKKG